MSTRREVLSQLVHAAGAANTGNTAMATPAFEWLEATALDLARAQAQGHTSAQALVQAYSARIAALDSGAGAGAASGPHVNSVIELNPDAMDIARVLDAERRIGKLRGPLHGVPVLIKDNIATSDAMQTSAGSPALLGVKPPRDAQVVARLRAAGAVILGKTNLSEWANFRGKNSISGWSTRGGQTRNPYALDRSPSGSSSGTGAALAANFAALGVGTETDGSITSPASACGLVGIKPTVGLVSRDGIVPIAFSQDTVGPMCRTVADTASLLATLAGVDARDKTTSAQVGKFDLAALLRLATGAQEPAQKAALRGARLGVAENLVEGHGRGTVALFEAALKALQSAGATLVRAPLPNLEKMGAGELEVLLFEMKHAMASYLAEFGAAGKYRSVADLVAYNRSQPLTLALFGQEWFELSAAKGPLTDPVYTKALAAGWRFSRQEGIDALLAQHRLDAIIAPTTGPAWLIDPTNGDSGIGPSATTPAAVAGYPHVTVPMGQVRGLPVGLSFFGGAWQEVRLLALAGHFEALTKLRAAPTFRGRSVGLEG